MLGMISITLLGIWSFGLATGIRKHWGLGTVTASLLGVAGVTTAMVLFGALLRSRPGRAAGEAFIMVGGSVIVGLVGGGFIFIPMYRLTKGREPWMTAGLGFGVAAEVAGVCLLARPSWGVITLMATLASLAFFACWKVLRTDSGWQLMSFMTLHYFLFILLLFAPTIPC